jgi:hypothetical protein
MSSVITVPAELVSQIHEGLYECLADAAEETSDAATRRQRERARPARWRAPGGPRTHSRRAERMQQSGEWPHATQLGP